MKHLVGLVSLASGVMLMLHMKGTYQFDWLFEQQWSDYFVPGLLILAGLLLLFHHCPQEEHRSHMKEMDVSEVMDENARLDINASFGGGKYNMSGERFTGADINALCGGVELDLRDAVIEQDCSIHIKAMLGGVQMRVPKDVRVEISSSCVMGGIENKTIRNADPNARLFRIKAECFMGGVEILN